MPKIYITGDSNSGAVMRAFTSLKDSLPSEFEIEVRHLGIGGGLLGNPFFIDHGDCLEVNGFRHADKTVKYPTGNMKDALCALILPFYSIRLSANLIWRKSAPAHMAHDEAPISKSILRAMCDNDQEPTISFLAGLKRLGVKVVAVECPRLFRHHKLNEKSRPEVVAYVDQLYRDMVCQKLDALEIPYIRVPAACIDEDGFTKPEYRSDDVDDNTHGNQAFGEIMLREILATARDMGQVPDATMNVAKAKKSTQKKAKTSIKNKT